MTYYAILCILFKLWHFHIGSFHIILAVIFGIMYLWNVYRVFTYVVYSIHFLMTKIALTLSSTEKKKQNIVFWLILTWHNPCHMRSKCYNCSRQLLVVFLWNTNENGSTESVSLSWQKLHLSNLTIIDMFVL